MKFQKISPLESTQFLQKWPLFVGNGLTLKNWVLSFSLIFKKLAPSGQPIFHKYDPFGRNFVDSNFFEYILSQPNSYKVNLIPTKSTQFLQTTYIGKSTQFLQMGQPNSNNRSQPISAQPFYDWFLVNWLIWSLSSWLRTLVDIMEIVHDDVIFTTPPQNYMHSRGH